MKKSLYLKIFLMLSCIILSIDSMQNTISDVTSYILNNRNIPSEELQSLLHTMSDDALTDFDYHVKYLEAYEEISLKKFLKLPQLENYQTESYNRILISINFYQTILEAIEIEKTARGLD